MNDDNFITWSPIRLYIVCGMGNEGLQPDYDDHFCILTRNFDVISRKFMADTFNVLLD